MISKEDNLKNLSCSLLDCGYLDLNFLLDLVNTIDNEKFIIKGEETFLFTIQDEGKIFDNAIENIKNNDCKRTINSLIYEVLDMVINRVQEIYNITLEDGKDYEIFVNCLDSHLSLIDDNSFLDDDEETDISKEEQEEIKNIIETFN